MKQKVLGFPITFCDEEGCETGYVDLDQYSWQDVINIINWWLGINP